MAISADNILSRLTPRLSFTSLTRLLQPLARRQETMYLGVVTISALSGYLLLLFFPLLALAYLNDIPAAFSAASSWQDWIWLLIDIIITLLALACSAPLLFNRFSPPPGLEITPDNAPKLVQLIEDLRADFNNPTIDRIILTPVFGVSLARTPRWRMPIMFQTTLAVGLDSFVCLPPDHFKLLLARRIGQLAASHNRFIGWLSLLRSVWPQYQQAFKRQKLLWALPLRFIFAIYAPFYAAVSFFAARRDELEADRYALDIAHDQDVAVLFSQLTITESFLDRKFWPKLRQLLARGNAASQPPPYTSMLSVLRRGLTREDMQEWIKTEFDATSGLDSTQPVLRQRLENIGHHKPASPIPIKSTAAEQYLDANVLAKVLQKFDQHWLSSVRNGPRR